MSELYELSFKEIILDNKVEVVKPRKIVFDTKDDANAYFDALHYVMDCNAGLYTDIVLNHLSI